MVPSGWKLTEPNHVSNMGSVPSLSSATVTDRVRQVAGGNGSLLNLPVTYRDLKSKKYDGGEAHLFTCQHHISMQP